MRNNALIWTVLLCVSALISATVIATLIAVLGWQSIAVFAGALIIFAVYLVVRDMLTHSVSR